MPGEFLFGGPPDPAGAPIEKLHHPRRGFAAYGYDDSELMRIFREEDIEDELAHKLTRALQRYQEYLFSSLRENMDSLEYWANVHTHGHLAGGGLGPIPEDDLYTVNGSTLRKWDKLAGTVTWTEILTDNIQGSRSIGMSPSLVVVGHTDGMLRAYSKDDGSLVWQTNVDGNPISLIRSTPTQLYVGTLEGSKLYLYNSSDGSFVGESETLSHPRLIDVAIEPNVAVYILYGTTSSTRIVAKYPINDWTSLIWDKSYTRGGGLAWFDDLLYLGHTSGGVSGGRQLWNASDGSLVDSYSGLSSEAWTEMEVDDTGVYWVDSQNPRRLRKYPLGDIINEDWSIVSDDPLLPVSVDNDFVYCSSTDTDKWIRVNKTSGDATAVTGGLSSSIDALIAEPGPYPFFR